MVQSKSEASVPLVDTHAHICDAAFDGDREAVLDRAGRAGVSAVVAVGENLSDAEKNLELARRHAILLPAAGLYPAHADMAAAREMEDFIRSRREALRAVGEVGLDFWLAKEDADRDLQRRVFRRFIRLSSELDLPLNVHSRSAGRHAVDQLLQEGARRVQLHAFDGRISAALPAVEAGYFFSVPPSVVRSRQKQKLIRHLPLECLMVETDSPVLGADPDARNEPMHLSTAVAAIAAIKGLPEQAVAEAVTENAGKLYRIRR